MVGIRSRENVERKMDNLSWLVSCRLIRLNPGTSWGRENVLSSYWETEYVQGQFYPVVDCGSGT